ncbi:MAG: recombinase family protein [Geobacteraceae bacterium]|nr:recombinase family protein [Geobacteraceae bacterium]
MAGQKIGYVRVSGIDQNTDRQLDGIELDEIFTDKITGKNLDRPELQAMLRFVRKGDELFVHSMDRLARNLVDLRQMVQDLTDRGVIVIFVKEGLTFTGDDNALSLLLLSVMGAVSEFERSVIRERQAEGIKIAKSKGVYKGRGAALTGEQIEQAQKMASTGVPKARIARELRVCRETVYKYLRIDQRVSSCT